MRSLEASVAAVVLLALLSTGCSTARPPPGPLAAATATASTPTPVGPVGPQNVGKGVEVSDRTVMPTLLACRSALSVSSAALGREVTRAPVTATL